MPKAEHERFDPVTGNLLDGGNGKDSTAAERKRRQRARARERDVTAGTVTSENVTRDTVTEDRDLVTGIPSPNPFLRLAHG
jgi:hypothetical protein